MDIDKKIAVLFEAVPFIKKYQGKTVLVKFGGNAMINEEIKQSVLEDAVLLQALGIRVVISHGGGPAINQMLDRVGVQSEFVDGLRVTSKDVIEVVEMVLAGKVNGELVRKVTAAGGKAVGISGVSAGVYNCKKRESKHDYGFVGDVISVDASAVRALLDAGFIPIVSPIGSDEHGVSYNINGDTAASELAAALAVDKMVLMTDIEGLCNDIKVRDVISYLNIKDVAALKEKGTIAGGMIPKVDGCVSAINSGVGSVHIIDGRKPHSLLYEAFSADGHGTVVGTDSESVGIKW